MNTKELLKKLVGVPAVGGSEDKINELLREILSGFGEIRTDAMNNLTCTFGEGYHILLEAHIDEIGFIVTSVTDDGFLKVAACGGIDSRMLSESEVTVWGKEKLYGIISALPPHLQKNSDAKKVPDIFDISIDLGLSAEKAKELVPLGSRVTFRRQFSELLNDRISSNCLDNRAGVAAVILALEGLRDLPVKITALFSTQEELGTRGAKIGPYGLNPDEAVAVDVSFGYTPDCKKEECGEISKGVMIGVSPVLSKEISNRLISCAQNNGINYQIEVMNSRTGTDADVISLSEGGIKCGLLSVPIKYMHSPVEAVDLADIEAVAKLICAYVRKKAGDNIA